MGLKEKAVAENVLKIREGQHTGRNWSWMMGGQPEAPLEYPGLGSWNHKPFAHTAEYGLGERSPEWLTGFYSRQCSGEFGQYGREMLSATYAWMHEFCAACNYEWAAKRGHAGLVSALRDWWARELTLLALFCDPQGHVVAPGCRASAAEADDRDIVLALVLGHSVPNKKQKWWDDRGMAATRVRDLLSDGSFDFGLSNEEKRALSRWAREGAVTDTLRSLVKKVKVKNAVELVRTSEGHYAWTPGGVSSYNNPQLAAAAWYDPHRHQFLNPKAFFQVDEYKGGGPGEARLDGGTIHASCPNREYQDSMTVPGGEVVARVHLGETSSIT